MAATEQIVTELIVDARGAVAGTQQYEDALKAAQTATDNFLASQQRSGQAVGTAGATANAAGAQVEASGRAYAAAQRNLNAYLGSLDPVFFATQRLGSEQKNLNAALTTLARQFAAGAVSVDQYQQRSALLRGRIGDIATASQGLASGSLSAKAALSAVSAETERATRAFGLSSAGFAELRASGVNTVQALASGIGVLQVAQTEGAQVLGAFVQGGRLTLSTLLSWGPALAAAAAAFAVFGLAISRAVERESDIRQFGVALRTLGTDGLATAQQLQETIEKLRQVGVPAAGARAALLDIARTPGINPAFGGEIVTLAHDLAAFAGDASQTEEWAKKITAAFAGGVENVVKFAASFNGLSAAEIANIREIGLHQGAAAALQKAFDDIRGHVLPAADSLGQLGQVAQTLRGKWDSLIDAFSKTGIVTGALGLVGDALDTFRQDAADIEKLVNLVERLANLPGNIAGAIGGNAAAANDNARKAQQDLADALRQRGATQDEIDKVLLSGGAPAAPPLIPGGSVPRALASQLPIPTLANPAGQPVVFDRAPDADSLAHGFGAFPSTVAPGAGTITVGTPAQSAEIAKQRDEIARTLELQKQWDAEAAITAARQKAEADAISLGLSAEDRQQFILNAVTAARQKQAIELGKAATLQDMTTAGTLKSADAYTKSAAAGLRDEAMQRARIEALQHGGDATALATRELEQNAAAAILSGSRQAEATDLVVAANQRLAAAARLGPAAEKEAAIQNQATAETQDALNKAEASGNQVLIDAAKALRDKAAAQGLANEAAQEAISAEHTIAGQQNQIEIAKLEVSLQGQTSEEIARQVALLRTKQELSGNLAQLSDDEKQRLLDSTDAAERQNIILGDAVKRQQAFDDAVRNSAETVNNTLTQALADAFSGQRVTDWGATLKTVIGQILSEIVNFALIRPVIGSALSTLGFNTAAQSFGISAAGGAGGAAAGGGGLLGTLGNGASLFGALGGGAGLLGAVNSFGSSAFGLANPALQGPTLSGATLGETGLLGSTSLGGLLGGAGTGFAAGTLLNTLVGGNQLGGTVGSGIGSLAGAAIGSILLPGFGTIAGGPIGRVRGNLFNRKEGEAA